MLTAPKRKKLFEAARAGDVERTRELLDKGLNVDTEGFYSDRALRIASSYGHCDVIEALLNRGARTDDNIAELALRDAISNRHACAVQLLLEGGVDPNANYYWGGTPLMRAAETSDTQIIELLLQHGADPNARGIYPDPPKRLTAEWYEYGVREKECEGAAIILAARGGSAADVALLLAHGADPDIIDSHGCTASLAAERNRHLDVITVLAAVGSNKPQK